MAPTAVESVDRRSPLRSHGTGCEASLTPREPNARLAHAPRPGPGQLKSAALNRALAVLSSTCCCSRNRPAVSHEAASSSHAVATGAFAVTCSPVPSLPNAQPSTNYCRAAVSVASLPPCFRAAAVPAASADLRLNCAHRSLRHTRPCVQHGEPQFGSRREANRRLESPTTPCAGRRERATVLNRARIWCGSIRRRI